MNRSMAVLAAIGVITLPGSCVATPVKGIAKPAIVAPAIVVAKPAPVRRLGRFQLNRAPEQGGLSYGTVPFGTVRLSIDGNAVSFDSDGVFVLGFGRDHGATATLLAVMGDGKSVSEQLVVATRAWKIENLATVQHHSQPDIEFAARRPAELDQINAARRIAVNSKGWRQKFIWPSRGRISGLFGSQRIYAGVPGSAHSGVDVAGGFGAAVVAPADGVVTLAAAAPFTLEGNLLIIDHGMGLNSNFLHLSRIMVKPGDSVRQGQLVGAIGATGRASGPHLHWGMKWKNERIDPVPIAGPMLAPVPKR